MAPVVKLRVGSVRMCWTWTQFAAAISGDPDRLRQQHQQFAYIRMATASLELDLFPVPLVSNGRRQAWKLNSNHPTLGGSTSLMPCTFQKASNAAKPSDS